jgi:predicted nucleotidyltransferase
MDNVLGLKEDDIANIIRLLKTERAVEQAIVFGSRAKGNYKHGSDVDIALKGKNLNYEIIAHLSYLLNEETLMPYRFDLINYNTIDNAALKEHIDRVGKDLLGVIV